MNSLFAKLSAALLAIVVLMGAAFFLVDRHNTRLYYEELTQQLNAPIAMYVIEQRQLIADGVADIDSLRDLAHHAMIINPTAEIYLLDATGLILGHGFAPDVTIRDRVDLEPVRALIAGGVHMPIHGDDPRSPGTRKVFSAAEIRHNGRLEGYLYVVLGGQKYEELASDIGSTYVGNVSAVMAVVIVLAAASVGLLVFGLLTGRLKRLSTAVKKLVESNFEAEPALDVTEAGTDEIDCLARSFVAMSAQIRQQIEQLKENDRLRRELVTNISHDLRTPLSAMQGYLETLLLKGESLAPEERAHYLKIARRHVIRLGTLIGDLFELSKLDSASVTPSLEAFSVPELAQDVVQEFKLEAERKGIGLSMRLDADTALTVGDIGLIQRVLENLVRNAIRFTPAGGEIVLSIAERPEAVSVAVSDTGIGIPENELGRIFDRFYRAEQGEEALSDSSGLGLAIVKRILDLHESRIAVTSRLNAGTRFEFELPRHRQAA